MSILSDNLSRQLASLKLGVPEVVAELNRRGHEVAYSTVAALFNGSRKPRKMEHLKALCEVLQTSISAMAGEDPDFAQDGFEKVLLAVARGLQTEQREAVLAIIKTMVPKA